MVKEKEKLVWLGVKRSSSHQSEAKGDIDRLQENVGEYSTFQTDLDNVSNESEFQTYLENNGFSTSEAKNFIERINNNFTDSDNSGSSFDEFKDYVQNDSNTYSKLKSEFSSQNSYFSDLETSDGEPVAGFRIFEQPGVTYDGVSVPAGSVEIFGQQIHFSQSEAPKSGSGSGSTGDGSTFTVNNISTDKDANTTLIGETVAISADVTNNGDYTEFFSAPLIEDGEVIENENFNIESGATEEVTFLVAKEEYASHIYQIATSGEIGVSWVPDTIGIG